MVRTNTVHERVGATGMIDYVVDVGNVLVDDRVVTLGKLVVPLRGKSFFDLPEDKGKYAVVNVYYDVDRGNFIFDRVLLSDKFVPSFNAPAIPNLLPVAQFVLKQSAGWFTVEAINEYSKMATYAIGTGGDTGERGLQGPLGPTGWHGYTGSEGWTGYDGSLGETGLQGPTGVGSQGSQGVQGCTGVYPDLYLLMYLKFKSDSEEQTDYSAYQRDCTWSVTGMGVTGSDEQSSFSRETGIVDNCHSVVYNGGTSRYKHDEYVDFCGFTGVLQAWVRVDVPPLVDFYYTGVQGVTGVLRFTERCEYFPETWSWYYDGTQVSTSRIHTQTVLTGEHLVKLESSNSAGSMSKTKIVVMP
jgi:hypothetical protein